MKLGFSETDITPKTPVIMVGFNCADNVSRGVRDSLLAQVSVWENNETCCLVTIDNIGFNKSEANLLRDRIGTMIGVSREKVMLSFSHTHAAVHVTAEKEYYDALCQKICLAAKKAKASMAEVSVGWDCVEADIGNNRREFSETVDRRVGVLKVSSRNTKDVKLIILRLTAHCNVLKKDNYLISADYFGAVRKVLREKYLCPIMIAVPGRLGQLLSLGLQQFVESFLYAAPNQLFELPLDYFLVKLYNLLRHGLLSPFEWCVATSFYQSSANHVSFYLLFNLRNLLYLIQWKTSSGINKTSYRYPLGPS